MIQPMPSWGSGQFNPNFDGNHYPPDHDDRSNKWQKHLLESIDERHVLDRVRQFYIDLIDDEINRIDSGKPSDLNKALVFPKNTPELRQAADLTITFGLGNVIDKLIENVINSTSSLSRDGSTESTEQS
ncbi:MAG: hypothetical protein NXI32_04085 [bacterium]|nr:hypothetical protein [bacterium]